MERVIPPSYDGTTPHPVILSLHGFTSSIDQINLFSGLPDAASERGYILLTPQAEPATLPIDDEEIEAPFWNVQPDDSAEVIGAQDDIGFLIDLLDTTGADLCVDAARVYTTGNSNGAGMSAALACTGGGRLAAIAPVSGINLAGPCDEPTAVSVIAFHGDADPLVAYEGGDESPDEADLPAVEDQVDGFARAADCENAPHVSDPNDDVEVRRWTGCREGIDVQLHTVLGGGHTWPGMLNYLDAAALAEVGESQELPQIANLDLAEIAGHMTTSIEATKLMLDFFDVHRAA